MAMLVGFHAASRSAQPQPALRRSPDCSPKLLQRRFEPGCIPCRNSCSTYICKGIFDAVVGGFLKHIFGGRHKYTPPPPKGCWVAANACYGKAGSSKLFDMVKDILQTPGQRMGNSGFGNGRFGSGPCGQYCLSLDDETTGSVFYEFGKDLDKYSPGGAN